MQVLAGDVEGAGGRPSFTPAPGQIYRGFSAESLTHCEVCGPAFGRLPAVSELKHEVQPSVEWCCGGVFSGCELHRC